MFISLMVAMTWYGHFFLWPTAPVFSQQSSFVLHLCSKKWSKFCNKKVNAVSEEQDPEHRRWPHRCMVLSTFINIWLQHLEATYHQCHTKVGGLNSCSRTTVGTYVATPLKRQTLPRNQCDEGYLQNQLPKVCWAHKVLNPASFTEGCSLPFHGSWLWITFTTYLVPTLVPTTRIWELTHWFLSCLDTPAAKSRHRIDSTSGSEAAIWGTIVMVGN